MNKKNILTKKNIDKLAKWIKAAADYFKEDGDGCYNYPLSSDLVLAIGWLNGYDMADIDIIKSQTGQTTGGNMTTGYAVVAGIRIRNDFDCYDFESLFYPWDRERNFYIADTTLSPNMTDKDYRDLAKFMLIEFVYLTNEIAKGNIKIAKGDC